MRDFLGTGYGILNYQLSFSTSVPSEMKAERKEDWSSFHSMHVLSNDV